MLLMDYRDVHMQGTPDDAAVREGAGRGGRGQGREGGREGERE